MSIDNMDSESIILELGQTISDVLDFGYHENRLLLHNSFNLN